MTYRHPVAIVLILSFAAIVAANATPPGPRQDGWVGGAVYDPDGVVLPGASVTLESGDFRLQTYSDIGGEYAFAGVPPGDYSMSVGIKGFCTARKDAVVVGRQDARRMDFLLAMRVPYDADPPSGQDARLDFSVADAFVRIRIESTRTVIDRSPPGPPAVAVRTTKVAKILETYQRHAVHGPFGEIVTFAVFHQGVDGKGLVACAGGPQMVSGQEYLVFLDWRADRNILAVGNVDYVMHVVGGRVQLSGDWGRAAIDNGLSVNDFIAALQEPGG